jgi:AraC-like DNA-binding protein
VRGGSYSETVNGWQASLTEDGINDVPSFGFCNFRESWSSQDYHEHAECVEFLFCTRGDCVCETPDGSCNLRAGMVIASLPGKPHRIKTYHRGLRMLWIRIRLPKRGTLMGLPADESDWIVGRLLSLPGRVFKGADSLKRAFRALIDAYNDVPSGTPERKFRLRAAVFDLMLALFSCGGSNPVMPQRRAIGDLVEEMREHPERDYAIARIASSIMMSPTGLITAFKRQTGYSPHAFLLSVRIEISKKLLAAGEPVSVVSDKVGFTSPKRFSVYFHQMVGVAPREFQRLRKLQL